MPHYENTLTNLLKQERLYYELYEGVTKLPYSVWIQEGVLNYLAEVTVKTNNRLTQCAGQANHLQKLIQLHPALLDKKDKAHYVLFKETLFHEIAHLIARRIYGKHLKQSHGVEWKYIMQCLRQKPSTYYDPMKCSIHDYKVRKENARLEEAKSILSDIGF